MGSGQARLEPLPALAGVVPGLELGAAQRAVGGHGGAQLSEQAPPAGGAPTATLPAGQSQPDEAPATGARAARLQSGGRGVEPIGSAAALRGQPGSGPAGG